MVRVGSAAAAVLVFGFASGCSDESRAPPRAPAVEDSFPQAFAASAQDDAYRVQRPPHVDLGYIGDSPIGTEPSPPHVDPPWEQPFTLDRPYASCPCRRACPVVFVPVPVPYQ